MLFLKSLESVPMVTEKFILYSPFSPKILLLVLVSDFGSCSRIFTEILS